MSLKFCHFLPYSKTRPEKCRGAGGEVIYEVVRCLREVNVRMSWRCRENFRKDENKMNLVHRKTRPNDQVVRRRGSSFLERKRFNWYEEAVPVDSRI